jgi:hypothetical protein
LFFIMSKWIGVDLDHTLAYYDEWRGIDHIGEPVPLMARRVRKWLDEGEEVRIFTARVSSSHPSGVDAARKHIQDWTEKHFGVRLAVTAEKDADCKQIWDDLAVGVERNTGRVGCQCFKHQEK